MRQFIFTSLCSCLQHVCLSVGPRVTVCRPVFFMPAHLCAHPPINQSVLYCVCDCNKKILLRWCLTASGVTRVQMKPGQLPNTKLIIIMIIVNFNWHLSYLVDLEVTFINSRVASWQLF